MLTELEAIRAVSRFFTNCGYRVTQQLSENQAGDDIVAFSSNGKEIMIEAKGETSSKLRTARFGKPFSPNQAHDHVSKAFFRAASYASQKRSAGIALPKNAAHVSCVVKIQPVLAKLKVEVFWVLPNRKVEVAGNWKNLANPCLPIDAPNSGTPLKTNVNRQVKPKLDMRGAWIP